MSEPKPIRISYACGHGHQHATIENAQACIDVHNRIADLERTAAKCDQYIEQVEAERDELREALKEQSEYTDNVERELWQCQEALEWQEAKNTRLKIRAGICPACENDECMADGVNLWCPACDASYTLEEKE